MLREKRKYRPWERRNRRIELLRLRIMSPIQRKIERITQKHWSEQLYKYATRSLGAFTETFIGDNKYITVKLKPLM
jgi:hypothetical protein